MFTGLIEKVGEIHSIEYSSNNATVTLHPVFDNMGIGESIALNGICLTTISAAQPIFELSHETFERTTLHTLKPKDRVNLERAIKLGDRLGGHWITGHVDCCTQITAITSHAHGTDFIFSTPDRHAHEIVEKGSIAIDGISLTVNTVTEDQFSVTIIPHTMTHTTIGTQTVGNIVNIETDILGKYVVQYLQRTSHG